MSKEKQKELEKKYQFQTEYVKDITQFKQSLFNKKLIPYQVEFQAPPRGKKICWLECPYCYGLSAEDNGDQAPDIAENVPAIFFEAVTNDLVLHAPQGKVRIIAQQVELVASGPEGAGNIVLSANGELLSKASETKIVSSGGAVFMANERVDVVAGTKLNTFGGNGETHAALKKNSIFSAVLAILGGNATLETTGVDLAKSIFGLEG